MKIIGITGGVGSGKTELLRYIRENYSCRILLSDEAAHEVTKKGGRIYEPLVQLLLQYPAPAPQEEREKTSEQETQADCSGLPNVPDGTRKEKVPEQEHRTGDAGKAVLLDENGEISRGEMAARIFVHKELLSKVNALIHPAVKEYILEAIAQEKKKEAEGAEDAVSFFFLEAALLIECGYRSLVDEMWYIYCDLSVRRKRLKESRGYSDEKIDGILASQLSEEEFRAGSDVVIDNSGSLEEAYAQIREVLRAEA